MTAYMPSEARAAVDEDLSGYPRDVLEFNFKQLAKSYADWCDLETKEARQRNAALYRRAGVGGHLYELVLMAERRGRKTIRIADYLEAARSAHNAEEDQ